MRHCFFRSIIISKKHTWRQLGHGQPSGHSCHAPIRCFSTAAPSHAISPKKEIKKVGVVGAGQMGIGIAQVASQVAKLNVVLMDVKQDILDKSLQFMDSVLLKNVAKGKMTEEERKETRQRIVPTTSLKDFAPVDFVIEAVSEDLKLKHRIFSELSTITSPDVILATNTSSISITKIASATNRPDKVIGMHFMNPVPVMALVEIIKGLATSQETLDVTLQLATAMGKTTAQAQDVPGFIANRYQPSLNPFASRKPMRDCRHCHDC
jgi:3-hydroxybutyryl-CoA dehydrogenase